MVFAAEDALFLPAAHKGMSTTRMNISNCNLSSERMVAYNIVKQPHAAAATGGAAFGFKLVKALPNHQQVRNSETQSGQIFPSLRHQQICSLCTFLSLQSSQNLQFFQSMVLCIDVVKYRFHLSSFLTCEDPINQFLSQGTLDKEEILDSFIKRIHGSTDKL